MAPWLMLNFVSSPLTIIPLVLEQQKKFFFIGISASIFQVLCFLVLPMILNEYKDGMYMVFQIITWSQVAIGLITVMFIFSIIQKEDRKNAAY